MPMKNKNNADRKRGKDKRNNTFKKYKQMVKN